MATTGNNGCNTPEKSRVRNASSRFPVGGGGSRPVYSPYEHPGSMIVYRNELSKRYSTRMAVKLHTNLLSGSTGRF